MPIRKKSTEPTSPRLKLMMYSLAGIGKTNACIDGFSSVFFIDTERGTEHYAQRIWDKGGQIFDTTSLDEIITQTHKLMTTNHTFKTIAIDSITPPYEAKVEEGATSKAIGDQWGKHIAYADRYAKKLFRMLTEIDLNVVVTAHAKDDWASGEKRGIKFDGWKKLDYLFDLVLELERRPDGRRFAIVRKTRLDAFKDQESFEWSADELKRRWGVENLEREAKPVVMATAEQVDALTRKVKALNIDEEEVAKWLEKTDADSFGDMTEEQIKKCLAHCDAKIAAAANDSTKGDDK